MKRSYYPIVIAAVTFVVMVAAAGVRAVPTMYVRPFESEFGWSDGVISNALALQIALYGLTGPFAAAAMERYGVRATMIAALAVLAAAMVALTRERCVAIVTVGRRCGHRRRKPCACARRDDRESLVRHTAWPRDRCF